MVFPNAERVSRTTNPAVLKCNMLTLCDDLGEGVQGWEGMQETRVLLWGGGFGGCIEVKFVKFGFFVLYSRVCVFCSFDNHLSEDNHYTLISFRLRRHVILFLCSAKKMEFTMSKKNASHRLFFQNLKLLMSPGKEDVVKKVKLRVKTPRGRRHWHSAGYRTPGVLRLGVVHRETVLTRKKTFYHT